MGGSSRGLPLFKGTLDLLVLKGLSFGPQHGYGIVSWLEARSSGAIDVDDSALYQALHRLEGRQLVAAEWGMTENNRRARFYTLTPQGRAALKDDRETWEQYVASVGTILARETR